MFVCGALCRRPTDSTGIGGLRPPTPGQKLELVELLGEHHAAQALVVTLDGSSLLTLTFGGGLFVELAGAEFGKETRLFDGALEAAEGNFKRFVFFNADSRQ